MYQIIIMHGDTEPWWFLEGWEEDIVESFLFDNYQEAWTCYQDFLDLYSQSYQKQETRDRTLTAFWNPGQLEWCEPCGEDLQVFQSVMLLHLEKQQVAYQKKISARRIKPCMLKGDA